MEQLTTSPYKKVGSNDIPEDYLVVEPRLHCFKGNNVDLNNLPKTSFIIPTFNSGKTLNECLESVINQEYPSLEIIIVDGYSNDNTIKIAKNFTNKIYFDSDTLGSARQTGFEQSTGEIIAMFDSDIIIPHSKWLINAIKYFNYSNKVSTIWPLNMPPPNAPLTARLYFNLWKIVIEDRIKNKRGLYGGGNSLFLRKFLEKVGGIEKAIHWGEDFDWAEKLRNYGYQVVLITDPLYHDTMRSLKQFTKKQLIGAKTFTKSGFGLMNLTLKDVFYEQNVLGARGMLIGLFKNRDTSWLLFPLFILIRALAYLYTYLANLCKL